MGELMRHRQTKGAATDMLDLTPPAPHSDSTQIALENIMLELMNGSMTSDHGLAAARRTSTVTCESMWNRLSRDR